jgi:hypothetical protein
LTDPVQIVVAAAALLVGFLLGYAVRSYVSRRRRRRATPLVSTDTKPDAADIHHGPGLVKALVQPVSKGMLQCLPRKLRPCGLVHRGICLLWELRRKLHTEFAINRDLVFE